MPDNTRIYRNRRRQVGLAAAVLGLFLVSVSVLAEPDPVTHTRARPEDYLWEVVPIAVLVLVLAGRALRTRIETNGQGLRVVRVTSSERVPWARVRGFEIHRTPTGRVATVVARLQDERLLRLWSFPVRRGTNPEAGELAATLEAERNGRIGTGTGQNGRHDH